MGTPSAGIEAKLLYDSTPNATPSTEVGEAREVTINGSTSMGKVVRRSSRQEGNRPTTIAASLEFDVLPDDDSTFITALIAAWTTHAALSFHAKSTSTGKGPLGDFLVESISRAEPPQDNQTYRVTLVPEISLRAWTWA